ncbi:MAG: FAD-dependent oxidoreductase [Azonexus sp.]|jgi:electron transfer flavoprotein-quinone oxidoreductase|uniref:FAD-dependent oxidoreductase n=1 Tax=Azonexus sp. TaxID=1872668 RepID=UPI002835B39A|nr:FAD-dependent oxidoreductase [Azonexus sp.]MDR0776919.1 FAD-dependent oxidoreductase [Azonexus sp.]
MNQPTEKFDVIVVGAGPAGNAAAYTLAKAGKKVLQLERGEYPGSKNVQGAILYADALEKIIPDFRDSAPLERHVVEQRMWLMEEQSHLGTHFRSDQYNQQPGNRYTIIRARFDKWFSDQVQQAGALVLCEMTVTELLKDESGRVIGVNVDRENGRIYADAVILADGVNSLVASRAGLREDIKPAAVALGVKEIIFMPKETIDARFNLTGQEGAVIEMFGSISEGMVGTGFLYTNKDSISVGIGCMLSDMKQQQTTPVELLEKLKRHPSVAPLIAGGETREYAAHLLPEGGYDALPKLYGEGWMLVGDSAGFLNAVHREGSNLAMTTGRLAAETLLELFAAGQPASASNLARYQARLDESFVMKDLKKYRKIPGMLDRQRQFVADYPGLLNQAAFNFFSVDGRDKEAKEKEIIASFRQRRSLLGLLGDAFRVWRATR